MKTITVTHEQNRGTNLIGALATAFDVEDSREIRHDSLFNTYRVNGVDYDVFLRDFGYLIVEAH